MTFSSRAGVRPLWKYRSKGVIWRIIPAGDAMLAGEERDTGKKTVRFFCLDSRTGKKRWATGKGFATWWESIEAVHADVLFLHEFPKPDMPDHGKIRALDLTSGDLLWSEPDLAFSFAARASVYASKDYFDRRRFYELDLRTGANRGEVGIDDVKARREDAAGPAIDLPSPSPVVPDVIRRTISGPVHAEGVLKLEAGSVEIWSLYEETRAAGGKGGDEPLSPGSGARYTHHLAVVAGGSVVFGDILGEDLTVPVPDAFFRLGERVFYVRGRKEIIALTLG